MTSTALPTPAPLATYQMAIEQAWESLSGTVRGFLLRRLHGDHATADDLTHEVFMKLSQHLGDLRSAASLGPFVMRIARNVLIDHRRRRHPTTGLATELLAQPEAFDDSEPADLAQLANFVRHQLDELPGHEAAAIRMVDLDGCATASAADQLGIGHSALKARLRRGRARLRARIQRCCQVSRDVRGQPTECTPHPASTGGGCANCA